MQTIIIICILCFLQLQYMYLLFKTFTPQIRDIQIYTVRITCLLLVNRDSEDSH